MKTPECLFLEYVERQIASLKIFFLSLSCIEKKKKWSRAMFIKVGKFSLMGLKFSLKRLLNIVFNYKEINCVVLTQICLLYMWKTTNVSLIIVNNCTWVYSENNNKKYMVMAELIGVGKANPNQFWDSSLWSLAPTQRTKVLSYDGLRIGSLGFHSPTGFWLILF